VLGGFESERVTLVGGHILTLSDFQRQFYVFENGMYGNWGFSGIYDKYIQQSQKIWNIIVEYLGNCSTSVVDGFLKKLLELDDSNLERLTFLISETQRSKKIWRRKTAIDNVERFSEMLYYAIKRKNMSKPCIVYSINTGIQ
jgi:hypothetical protein